VIVATGLTRRFGRRVAVDSVTFAIARGEIVALLGPNGAGKTTTMRMLAGLIAPSAGSVQVAGVELTSRTGGALRKRIGFLTETPGLWDRLTVRENLAVYAGLYGIAEPGARVDRLLGELDLLSHADARAAELSKGMRQKVAIARALVHDPDVLLLDEPTSGLDPEIARTVRRLLDERRSRGCAILLSTHNLHEAERHADRVAVLHRRLLVIDAPSALRARLSTGRVLVRVSGDAEPWRAAVLPLVQEVGVEGGLLTLRVADPERDTPGIVRQLTSAGAPILEVRGEEPAIEDVYLHFMGERP